MVLGVDGNVARHIILLLALWLRRMAFSIAICTCRLEGNGAHRFDFRLLATFHEKLL